MHATPSCCVWAHRTPLYACRPHVLPVSMKNARKKNCARFQSVCAAKDSKRTGGHPAFVSQNQTCALAFWALISPYGRFPPMRYHSRDTNRRRTIKSPLDPVSRPRSVNRPKSSSGGVPWYGHACDSFLLRVGSQDATGCQLTTRAAYGHAKRPKQKSCTFTVCL